MKNKHLKQNHSGVILRDDYTLQISPRSPIKCRSKQGSPQNQRYLSPVSLSQRKNEKTKRTIADEQQQVLSRTDSYGPSNGSTIYEENCGNRYYSIVNLTTRQNQNLRQQNQYLLEKLKKMKEREQKIQRTYNKAKKYKAMYLDSLADIEMLKQQCQVYRKQAEEMKEIALRDIYSISQKVIAQNSGNQSGGQQQSEILQYSNQCQSKAQFSH